MNPHCPYPQEAVDRTVAILNDMAARYDMPAILSSWSKDSMVLRDIIRRQGYDWPIITYMTEWHPRKWSFARRMSDALDEPIITYNPQQTWIYEQDGAIVLGSTYQLGANPHRPGMEIHVDVIEPPEDASHLPAGTECGMVYLSRLRGTTEWRWDAVAIGHRDVDRDRFLGAMPLESEVVPMDADVPDLCFPLKHWTDREIWNYTIAAQVPVDWRRYSMEALWDDPAWVPSSVLNEHNNDCIHACVRCMKSTAPQEVHCPSANAPISNVSAILPRVTTLAKPYFTPTPQ